MKFLRSIKNISVRSIEEQKLLGNREQTEVIMMWLV